MTSPETGVGADGGGGDIVRRGEGARGGTARVDNSSLDSGASPIIALLSAGGAPDSGDRTTVGESCKLPLWLGSNGLVASSSSSSSSSFKGGSNKTACFNNVNVTSDSEDVVVAASSSPSHHTSSSNKDKMLSYPSYFKRSYHNLLLDTGAEKSLVSYNFVKLHNLKQLSTKRKTLILADQSTVVVNKVIAPITINLGSINIKIYGLVCLNLTIDIIAGLDWLRVFKPIIDWDTSMLTVTRKGINYHVYPQGVDHLLKDYVFVKLAKSK